jgi:hypothetical protein
MMHASRIETQVSISRIEAQASHVATDLEAAGDTRMNPES